MYKVLFAEDELLVRLGLQNSIPWEKFQMEIAAEAENGEEAYRLFRKIRPDVLITDLRMEGMDGLELVKQVRKEDQECAIVVISCLNDFETIRNLLPYKINAYVLKASITIDEICDVLKQVQEYLVKIGKTPEKSELRTVRIEESISEYLLGETEDHRWDHLEYVNYLLLFRLSEDQKEKINMLAMDFIYESVNRQMPGKLLIPLHEKEFCVFYEEINDDVECCVKRINSSIEEFLGVKFEIICSRRADDEVLKEWFERAYTQEYKTYKEENSGKNLIRKSIIYMQEHYREELSLTDISKIIGLSGNYFSHLFKKETGKSYVEYLNEIRLREVMKDLKKSDEKILTIAQKHGFQNLEYFSRFFKRQTGESPAKWRKINK